MGLDQYAYARKGEESIEIMYWRKHADLQGWMSDLYFTRNGGGDFNCVDLKLDDEDIDKLELEHESLEKTAGFFFGESSPYKVDQTKDFIQKAREMSDAGYDIIYSSWW